VSVLVLTVGKIAFLVGLYLFVAWCLRTVAKELRETTEPAGAGPDLALAAHPQFAIVEPRHLRGQRIALAHNMTIGRGEGCTLRLDDSYASGVHARVMARGDDFFVEDAGSTNGTYVNRRRVTHPKLIRRGDTVQIGRTVLEVVK
jgi:pSer/pThr/pTyr-binding forkhead associated (FHA) protein